MLNALLTMALAGSGGLLLCLALIRLGGRSLSARWQDWALRLCLLLLLVPLAPMAAALEDAASAQTGIPAVYADAGTDASRSPALAGDTGTWQSVPSEPEAELSPAADSSAPEAAAPLALPAAVLTGLTVLWGVGAAVFALYKARAWLRFRRRVLDASVTLSAPRLPDTARDRAREAGLARTPVLRVSPLISTPFAVGLLRPAVVLPLSCLEEGRTLDYVLVHEFTHIRRGDLWFRALALLARTVHWYLPPAHLLAARLREADELACDEAVAAGLSQTQRYEYGVLLLRAAGPSPQSEWAASLSAGGGIRRRLERMYFVRRMTRLQQVLAALALVCVLLCGTAAALAVRDGLVTARTAQSLPQSQAAQPSPAPAEEADQRPDSEGQPGLSQPEASPDASEPSGTDSSHPADSADTAQPSDGTAGSETAPLSSPAGSDDGDTTDTTTDAGAQPPQTAAQSEEDAWAAAQAEVDAMELDVWLDALSSPCPTVDELLAIPAVAAWRADDPIVPNSADRRSDEELAITREVGAHSIERWNSTPEGAAAWQAMLDLLVDGDYPRNSRGESYGPSALEALLLYEPDLVLAVGVDGTEGYIRWTDQLSYGVDTLTDVLAYQQISDALPNGYLIPLYDQEGTAIGWFQIGG